MEYKDYEIIDNGKQWRVKRRVGSVQVEYKISKELADTQEELKAYIDEHKELF